MDETSEPTESGQPPPIPPVLIAPAALQTLIGLLLDDGYQVIGPQVADGAIVYRPLAAGDTLPAGWQDQQDGGSYRLTPSGRSALFDYVVGPHSWKRYLFPSRLRLWRAERGDDDDAAADFTITDRASAETPPRYAFIGARDCELRAMAIQDRVFANGDYHDPVYLGRRETAFIVAVDCARPAATCFCTSSGGGPAVGAGFDLALTEICDDERHELLVRAGSERGAALLARLPGREADAATLDVADAVRRRAADAITRELPADAERVLKDNPEHPRWDQVADRCLSCGNCTLVCPTCFCFSVEEHSELDGSATERWREWDSCFSVDFSYIHGGSIRVSGRSRYRQWLRHKLAYWHDQFDSSGCVGCGRCITWCPVGIDLTEEVRAIGGADAGDGTGEAS